jgi:hypothetical protein
VERLKLPSAGLRSRSDGKRSVGCGGLLTTNTCGAQLGGRNAARSCFGAAEFAKVAERETLSKYTTRHIRMGVCQGATNGFGRKSFSPWSPYVTTATRTFMGRSRTRNGVLLDTAHPDQFSRCLLCGKAMKPNEDQVIRGWRSPHNGEQRLMIMHRACRKSYETRKVMKPETRNHQTKKVMQQPLMLTYTVKSDLCWPLFETLQINEPGPWIEGTLPGVPWCPICRDYPSVEKGGYLKCACHQASFGMFRTQQRPPFRY